jgi:hypothetical protein
MNFKKQLRNICMFLPMCGVTFLATAASTYGSVPSTVRIMPPISLTNLPADCLDFGSVAKGTSTTLVTLSPDLPSVVTYSGGDAHILSTTTPRPAMFTVGGEVNKTYTITLPTTTTITNGTTTLTLSAFTCSKSSNIGTIAAYGNASNNFYVGASLSLPITATQGNYTGTISVTVAYN